MSMALLSEMIASLRRELSAAQTEGAESDLKFEVNAIDLELQLLVRDEGKANGGIKFWVLNAGIEEKVASEAVQKIKLSLKPTDSQKPGPVEIKSERNIE